MVDKLTLYHNPRCSKSRAALALLRERGVAVTVVRYLDEPLDGEALSELLCALQLPASAVVRRGEAAFKRLQDTSEPALLAALAASPILLERPIVRRGNRALIGRPPERVLELLDHGVNDAC